MPNDNTKSMLNFSAMNVFTFDTITIENNTLDNRSSADILPQFSSYCWRNCTPGYKKCMETYSDRGLCSSERNDCLYECEYGYRP